MKNKFSILLAGTIALSFTVMPSIAQDRFERSQLGQAQTQRKFEGVELTETQRTQLREIHRNTRSQIESVLTSEQRRQLEASREEGNKRQGAFAEMNLSSEQKSQIRSIMRSAKNRTDDILTPAQRQEVQRNREQKRQARQYE